MATFGVRRIVLFLCVILPSVASIRWLGIKHSTEHQWKKNDCKKIHGFTGQQYSMCRRNLPIMRYVTEAVEMTREECTHQLQDRRWNCSTISRAPLLMADLKRGTKETAFVFSLSAAAVSYTVTQACSTGRLETCECGRNPKLKLKKSNWEWGGCSDNIAYGTRFSKRFTEAVEKHRMKKNRPMGQTLMNIHNTEVGRRAVRDHMEIICKCHGVSGACQTKTCFRRLSEFRKVGTFLRKRYDKAIVVINKKVKSNREKRILRPKKGRRHYTTRDLICLTRSPDYCVKNRGKGTIGTKGRICDPTKRSGKGSCAYLCCRRGHRTKTVVKVERCECRYVWCCYVECKKCKKTVQESRCR